MSKVQHIIERIENLKNSGVDMRAEVLANDLLGPVGESSRTAKNTRLEVFVNGVFKRPHSKDIEKVEIYKDDSGDNVLRFELNREGIYDALPKGLFHEAPRAGIPKEKKLDPEARHLKILAEKAQARKLFYPYDQEIFKARLLKEAAEADYVRPLNVSSRLKDYRSLWSLPEDLPKASSEKLADLIPYAAAFNGDRDKTARLISFMVGAPCEIREGGETIPMKDDSLIPELGVLNLATSFTLAGVPPTEKHAWVVCIGPIKKERISAFLPEGIRRRELEIFGDYFFPLHLDVRFEVIVKKDEQGFILSDDPQDGRLAYSSNI